MIGTPRWRYVGGAVGLLFLLHLIFSIHPTYRERTAVGLMPSGWGGSGGEPIGSWKNSERPDLQTAPFLPTFYELREAQDTAEMKNRTRANAAFVVLARNSDRNDFLSSMQHMEDRFNYWAQYDYIFLNDEPFDDDFKKYTQRMTKAKCHYGLIDADVWNQPDWIDEERAKASREDMIRNKIIYGHSVPYRNMCRFNSGFFFRHPLLASYDYYWRIEPGVQFFCDLHYDPFLYMQKHKKVYGFTISLYEYEATIMTLWAETKKFMEKYPQYIHPNNAMKFLSDNGGDTFNLCHFWSNFEIGDLRFWRSEAYTKYFEHLEATGGFYYERWGDAPIHSIAVALFLDKDEIHWFDDIGYNHPPFNHCPQGEAHERGRCWCDPAQTFDWASYSCTSRWVELFGGR